MTWQIYLALSIIIYSLAVIFQKGFLKDKDSDPVAYSVIVQLVIAIISALALIKSGFHTIQYENEILISLVILAVVYALGSIFSFMSLKMIEASEYSILIFTKTFWSVLLAVLILGEPFSWVQIIGGVFIFLSVMLASFKGSKLKFGKGEIFAILAALFVGAGFINDAILINKLGFWEFMVLAFLLPPLTILLILPKSISGTIKLIGGRDCWKPFFMGILFFGSGITTYLALDEGDNPAQLAVLSPVVIIVVVILSAIFLKERNNLLKKIIAGLICIAGIILVN